MSEKLMLLLQRIQSKPISMRPMTEEEMAAQDAKTNIIINRIANRYYKEEMLARTLETVKDIKQELRFYHHVLSCGQCLMEVLVDVERHGGSHVEAACLDLTNNLEEIFEDVDFVDLGSFSEEAVKLLRKIPKVSHYRIGSYWTGVSEDTVRFIKDRLTWAKQLLLLELKAAREYYRKLLAWNLNGDPPEPFYRLI